MNTKCKTTASAVTHPLGRSLRVLPPGSLAGASPVQREINSAEKRVFQRTPSTGSLGTKNSDQTRSEVRSANIKRQSARLRVQTNKDDSQKVSKIINKESADKLCTERERTAGSKQENKITTSDILQLCNETEPSQVFDIDLHGKSLSCIPELEHFKKLRCLDVSSNYIKKISELGSNMDLCELKLYDNQIATIEGLGQLKYLCSLQLQHNKIAAIGRGLESLKKLQFLRLDNNQITKLELSELLSCPNIVSLDLSNNKLESLAPLNYLPNLEELFAAGNKIQKTGDLTKCKKLQEVDLARNQISELSGLANLANLQILDISQNRIKSLKSLGKLRSLEEMNINSNKVEDLSSFASQFPSLQILCACDNMVVNLEEIISLSSCVDLVELYATGNPFMVETEEMPNYHQTLSQALPNLEVIDGISLKKSEVKQENNPLMRPMTASSMISLRQINSQLKATTEEQDNLFKDISERFNALRSLVGTLPSESPRSSRVASVSSRCSSRSRLADARNFAASNFEDKELDSF